MISPVSGMRYNLLTEQNNPQILHKRLTNAAKLSEKKSSLQSNKVPNDVNYVWLGGDLPTKYRLIMHNSHNINPHYNFNLYHCTAILSLEQHQSLQNFCNRNRVNLRDISEYDWENAKHIENAINDKEYAKAADLIRAEDELTGIYNDTDNEIMAPLPSSINIDEYGIIIGTEYVGDVEKAIASAEKILKDPFSSENEIMEAKSTLSKDYEEAYPTNSIIARSFGGKSSIIMAEYRSTMAKKLENLAQKLGTTSTGNKDSLILSSTGPECLVSVLRDMPNLYPNEGFQILPEKFTDRDTLFSLAARTRPLDGELISGYIESKDHDLSYESTNGSFENTANKIDRAAAVTIQRAVRILLNKREVS